MKSRLVSTVASDDENLRLRIYEGDIPLDQAGAEQVRLLEFAAVRANDRALMFMDRAWKAERRAAVFGSLLPAGGFRGRAAAARAEKPRKVRTA